jgi:hypothetical protein
MFDSSAFANQHLLRAVVSGSFASPLEFLLNQIFLTVSHEILGSAGLLPSGPGGSVQSGEDLLISPGAYPTGSRKGRLRLPTGA